MEKADDPERTPQQEVRHLEPIKSSVTHETTGKHIIKRIHTLGSLRHRHEHTGEIILIPTPSNDPNDPLNW